MKVMRFKVKIKIKKMKVPTLKIGSINIAITILKNVSSVNSDVSRGRY